MRAAVYSCVSIKDDPQIANGQILQMETRAHDEGIETVLVYRDVVETAGANRPAYQKMLLHAKRHHFDVLIFWDLVQLSRQNANNTMLLLHKILHWGIDFYSYTEKYLDTCHASKEIVSSVISILVRQNKIYIGEQTRIGIERQKKTQKPGPKGKLGPGRPPVIFDQKQARDLRLKGKPYAAIAAICGVSKATICRFFKGQALKTKTRKRSI